MTRRREGSTRWAGWQKGLQGENFPALPLEASEQLSPGAASLVSLGSEKYSRRGDTPRAADKKS